MVKALALALLGVALLLPAAAAPAQTEPLQVSALVSDPEAAIAYSQAAIGRRVGDYAFRDTTLAPVRLADYRGQPLVVNLVYTACNASCPVVVQSLDAAVDTAREALGSDRFSVVTIGFDARGDTPQRLRAFARQHGIEPGQAWRFLSAPDQASVTALAGELGFIVSEAPQGFDHIAQTSVLDAEGRVFRQVYGANFAPPALVEPLKALITGQLDLASPAGLIERVRLFCTLYDPASGRYRIDYSIVIAAAVALASLLGMAGVLIRALAARRRPQT